MGEVHDLSLFLLEFLEEQNIEHDLAIAAVALTVVRLAHPLERLSAESEIAFTQEIIQMSQMQGGSVN